MPWATRRPRAPTGVKAKMRSRSALLPTALAAAVWLFSAPLPARGAAVEVFAKARRGVVAVISLRNGHSLAILPAMPDVGERILGSAIVLSEDGMLLTANHAVAGVEYLGVVMADMTQTHARLIAASPVLDVAILKANLSGLEPLEWRGDRALVVGETCYAVGTPSVFSSDPTPSISKGIVSALHRTIEGEMVDDRKVLLRNLIETDAQILPGESGGALLDEEGRLLGMCLAIHAPGGSRGRAYAVPADAWLARVVAALSQGRPAPIGSLGAQVVTLGMDRAVRSGLTPRAGVQVISMDEDGPLAGSGLEVGDVITHLGGKEVKRVTRYRQMEMRLEPGSRATVRVIRPGVGEPLEFEVAVAPSHLPAGRETAFRWRGARLVSLTDETRRRYGTHFREGVLVMEVDSGSRAFLGGLRVGDVIVEIGNFRVRNLTDFRALAKLMREGAMVKVRTTQGIGHIQGETRQR